MQIARVAARGHNNIEVAHSTIRVPKDGRGASDKGLSQARHPLTHRICPDPARQRHRRLTTTTTSLVNRRYLSIRTALLYKRDTEGLIMNMIIDRTTRAGPHRAATPKVVELLLVALLALALTGCLGNTPGIDPVSWPAPSNQAIPLGDPTGSPDDYGVYSDEPGTYSDPYGPGYPYDPGYPDEPVYPDAPVYPDEPGGDYTDDSGSGTNPCAFPGDLLCPDTLPTVPPPQLNPPF
jgi:hypothetical protein